MSSVCDQHTLPADALKSSFRFAIEFGIRLTFPYIAFFLSVEECNDRRKFFGVKRQKRKKKQRNKKTSTFISLYMLFFAIHYMIALLSLYISLLKNLVRGSTCRATNCERAYTNQQQILQTWFFFSLQKCVILTVSYRKSKLCTDNS